MVIHLEQGADCLHVVQLMPLHPKPRHLLPHVNSDWFTFLVLAYPGHPGKEAAKRVYSFFV